MLPRPMSRFEPSANDSSPPPASDLTRSLGRHVQAGFPPDLALDLVLNELVAQAADATHASAAALALVRGEEMVCRAATGLHAPDLGIPLNIRDGLSGACVRTRSPQLSADTESDPRVDGAISRRLGIRSMLIVPVFEEESKPESSASSEDQHAGPYTAGNTSLEGRGAVSELPLPQLAGVLEVFSPLPNAFSRAEQMLLEDFARECARIRQVATRLHDHPIAEVIPIEEGPIPLDEDEEKPIPDGRESSLPASVLPVETVPAAASLTIVAPVVHDSPPPVVHVRQRYEAWTLVMGAIVIFAAAAVSFMIGSRVGWIRSPQPVPTQESIPPVHGGDSTVSTVTPRAVSVPKAASSQTKPKASDKATKGAVSNSDELVVYEKGKVIFRMNPAPNAEEPAAAQAQSPPGQSLPAQSASAQSAKAAGDSGKSASAAAASAPTKTTPTVSGSLKSAASGAQMARTIWLGPEQAESRLVNRVEPQYPADALAAHRSGSVTLEVRVAEDGTVSSVGILDGDPMLAAAATQAVRSWRYQPYRLHDKPSPFQTDVTLTFSLPN